MREVKRKGGREGGREGGRVEEESEGWRERRWSSKDKSGMGVEGTGGGKK